MTTKTCTILVRVTPEVKAKLKQSAINEDRSLRSFVSNTLLEWSRKLTLVDTDEILKRDNTTIAPVLRVVAAPSSPVVTTPKPVWVRPPEVIDPAQARLEAELQAEFDAGRS